MITLDASTCGESADAGSSTRVANELGLQEVVPRPARGIRRQPSVCARIELSVRERSILVCASKTPLATPRKCEVASEPYLHVIVPARRVKGSPCSELRAGRSSVLAAAFEARA